MLPFPIVYSDDYELELGAHVFPAAKYRLIHERLLAEGHAAATDFIRPPEASDEDVLLVHTRDWVTKLRTGTVTYADILRMEIPYSPELVKAFWLSAGGSILASRKALEGGAGFNLCGGFHHAFPGHGEGFCMIHDVAIAIRRLQEDGAIRRALIVDLDVHQGNGTAAIFSGDGSGDAAGGRAVFTFSMHQENNYPHPKPPSTLDINLPDGIGDDEYHALLAEGLERAFASFQPDLVWYLAGADPYREDQLGGLGLTIRGLRRRDDLVLRAARQRGIPAAVTLAGGYARRLEDTVTIHTNTVLALRDTMEEGARSKGARSLEKKAQGE